MAQKFLTNVELEAGLVDGSNSTGTSGFLLSSTGTATSWVDPAAVSVGESEQVHIACKNTSGVAISKGDPVYITGTVGTSFRIQIAAADASNSAKMPAVGLAETDLGINAEGFVIVSGVLKNLTTDPLSTSDGTPSSNDTVYVKAGGGLTKTKPTGSGNLIQNVGKVGRVNSASAGSLAVSTIMRTNDVPNLTTGKIWVGSSTYTTESTVVHLDEANGRMGIGTTSPGQPLHVNGNARVDGDFFIIESNPQIFLSDTNHNSDFSINLNSGLFKITDTTNSADRITLDSSGNVGIGTTSPNATLDVNGAGNFSGGTVVSGIDTQTVGVAVAKGTYIKSNDGNYLRNIIGHTSSGNIEIGQAGTSLIGDILLRPGSAGNIRFFGTGSEDMRITSSGSVGIGTTSPGQKLHVNGNIRVGDSADVIYSNKFTTLSNSNLLITANTGYDTTFTNGGSERMRITTAGNVGIGTINPQRKFHVNGIARIQANGQTLDLVGTDHSYIGFYPDGAAAGRKAYIGFPGATSDRLTIANEFNDDISFFTNGSEKVTIQNDGNVGIGTTSPSHPLTIVSSYPQIKIQQTGQTPSFTFGSGSGYAVFDGIGTSGSLLDIRDDGTSRMRIDASGNVGIGTSSPGAKLDVAAGDIRLGTNATYFRVRDTASAQPRVLGMNASNNFYIGPIDSYAGGSMIYGTSGNMQHHRFYIAGSEQVRITSGGNVGIGTTNPSYKLDLQGDLRVDNGNLGGTSGDEIIHAKIHGQRHFLEFKEVRTANGTDWKDTTYKLQAGVDTTDHQSIDFVADGSYQEHIDIRTGNQAFNTRFTYDGKVGIGTTSPTSKLHVAQDQNNTFSTAIAWTASANDVLNITNNNSTDTNNYASLYMRADGSSGNFSSRIVARNTTAGTGELHFQLRDSAHTANTETKLMIDSGGNVGIGTTSPTSLLTLESSSSSPYTGIDIKSTAYYPGGEIRFLNSAGGEVSVIESYNNPGRQDITMRYNASSTGGKCELQDNAAILGAGTSAVQSYLQVGITDFRVITNYGTRMYINTLGNVGIGTTSPSYTLDVNGVIRGEQYLRLADTGGTNRFSIRAESTYGTIDNGSNTLNYNANNHLFLVGLSEKMRINSLGNVGIGTTTPLYLLDAAGTIRCTSLIQTSQSNKKENIGDIDKSKPKAIPFKEYRYKSDIDSTGRKRYGVLAEDIENDYPELVYVDSNGDKAVNYIDLLVKRVAELEKELEDISLTPGPKGDKGDTGAQGPVGANGTNGKDGANGNDHLKNVKSISFNEKTGQLEITIEGYKDSFKFNPAK